MLGALAIATGALSILSDSGAPPRRVGRIFRKFDVMLEEGDYEGIARLALSDLFMGLRADFPFLPEIRDRFTPNYRDLRAEFDLLEKFSTSVRLTLNWRQFQDRRPSRITMVVTAGEDETNPYRTWKTVNADYREESDDTGPPRSLRDLEEHFTQNAPYPTDLVEALVFNLTLFLEREDERLKQVLRLYKVRRAIEKMCSTLEEAHAFVAETIRQNPDEGLLSPYSQDAVIFFREGDLAYWLELIDQAWAERRSRP